MVCSEFNDETCRFCGQKGFKGRKDIDHVIEDGINKVFYDWICKHCFKENNICYETWEETGKSIYDDNIKKSYLELLKDPKWQKKRLKIFERDEWTCQKCGSKTNTLSVHHTFYAKGLNPWEYEDKSLVTLCESCHKKEIKEL